MRAITVRQPWAWAIIHGGKDVENRSRNIAGSYRGLVAIHAGLAIDEDYDRHDIGAAVGRLARANPGGSGLAQVAQYARDEQTPGNSIAERFGNRGAIIGVVELTDVHDDCTEMVEGFGHTPTCSPWAMSDHHHLILSAPIALPRPIPCKGRLGLWTLPDEISAKVAGQIGETLGGAA